jgi:hypothetical protein
MKQLTPLFCLLALASCTKKETPAPPPAPVKTVTFSLKQPAAGTKHVDLSSYQSDVSLTAQAGDQTQRSVMTSRASSLFTVEYLEVEGATVKKARITYGDKKSIDLDDGKGDENVSPVANKTYLLEAEADDDDDELEVTVRTADGTEAPASEADVVRDDADFIGKPDQFRSAFPSRALKVGEPVPELVKAVQDLVTDGASGDGANAPKISDVRVTLTEDRGEVAIFSTTMTMDNSDEKMTTVIKLAGTLEVRKADTQLLLVDLKGPVTLASQAKDVKVEGTGKMAISIARKFQ